MCTTSWTISRITRMGFAGLALPVALSIVLNARAAGKMDIETHTLLINKLERVLEHGSTAGADDAEVRLRLADLLAERARLHIVAAEGKESSEAKRDRRRALEIYRTAVERSGPQRRAQVLVQMAHLHETAGDRAKAVALYRRVVTEGTKTYPEAVVGQAMAAWGDVLYRQGEFRSALEKFEGALQLKKAERRGYITYRIAWCNLNLGRQSVATQRLIEILRTPELLTRQTATGSELDVSFQEDVSRDLVSFIARGDLGAAKIRLLLDLTPEAIRRDNLRALAGETERLGKKKESILVWSMILENEPSSLERIDGRVRLAILEWGLNRKKNAVEQLSLAMSDWKTRGCSDTEECKAIQARARKLIVDWNRLEKDQVSDELFAAYALYNNQFNDEYDMQFWAAQTGRLLKKYNQASELYRRSSVLAREELNKSSKGQNNAKARGEMTKMFEAALIAQIEMAESGGDLDLKLKAYEHYLNLNPKGDRSLEVRYQRARALYDKGRHDAAAEEFRTVAMTETKTNSDTRKKAADLALDSLVLAKQEGRIEGWALEFAQRFPSDRTEFLTIARRAVLKDVAAVANDVNSGESELKRAALRLSQAPLDGASSEERTSIFKSRLALAVRARDLGETTAAADRLLNAKGLAAEDREFALEKKVWVAEMRLDFATAHDLSSRMRMAKLSEADRHLRLAYLAELGGRNASRHYENVLKSSNSKAKSETAAARLVRLSKRPWAALKRVERHLKGNRELLSDLVLESYARTGDKMNAQAAIARNGLRNSEAGYVIARATTLPQINELDRKMTSHQLITTNDTRLQTSLKVRLALLAKLDKSVQEAIRSKDWRMQVITLTIAGRENARLHGEILKLPIPRKLTPEQRDLYTRALAERAAPFQAKADEIKRKTDEFWSNEKNLTAAIAAMKNGSSDVTRLLANDLRQLANRAPSSARARLERAIRDSQSRPTAAEVARARRALQADPFSVRQARALKDLEANLGRDAMVAHLDARVLQLEGGAK